jgi:cation transport ATPase
MPRWLLPTLIVVATALFVTGVAIERNSGDEHVETGSSTAAQSKASGGEGEEAHSEREEGGAATDEHASKPAAHETKERGEDKLLGVDVESIPLVALAAFASLSLALAAWLRPTWVPLLTLIAVASIAFAALDIREVFHQLDEDKAGLAVLAALVAVVHVSASGLAVATHKQIAA